MTEPPKIKHLVISGGGGTGLAYYSILRESNKDGFWNIDDIDTVHGVSAGSYLVFFIAVLKHIGWDAYDDYIIKRPWEQLFTTKNIFNAYNNVGIFGREIIENIFSPILKAADLSLNITLQELYDFTGIELHYYTTNLDTYEYVDLSHKTHPDLSLIDAAYCSSAVPVLFRPNRMNGEVYVDGAFLCNYPIQQCINLVKNCDEIFGIKKKSTKSKTKRPPFDSLSKEITGSDKEYPEQKSEYSNIIDYLLDIIAKTAKKMAIENTESKYTMYIEDKTTNVWEIYNTIKSKESRLAKMNYGIDTWNQYKKQIQFIPLNSGISNETYACAPTSLE